MPCDQCVMHVPTTHPFDLAIVNEVAKRSQTATRMDYTTSDYVVYQCVVGGSPSKFSGGLLRGELGGVV